MLGPLSVGVAPQLWSWRMAPYGTKRGMIEDWSSECLLAQSLSRDGNVTSELLVASVIPDGRSLIPGSALEGIPRRSQSVMDGSGTGRESEAPLRRSLLPVGPSSCPESGIRDRPRGSSREARGRQMESSGKSALRDKSLSVPRQHGRMVRFAERG